jgi:hypothetical protein
MGGSYLLENNKLRVEDEAVHDWYRFVLSYPPHLVRQYIERFNLSGSDHVLDPFCGTGTTVVECRKLGIPTTGIESHPLLQFAASTKIGWDVDPTGLLDHAERIANLARQRLQSEGIYYGADLPLFEQKPSCGMLIGLPDDVMRLLIEGSISPVPLHKTLVLLRTMETEHAPRYVDYERLALASSLVNGIGNLRFGPEVGITPPREDAPVVDIWLRRVADIARDVKTLSGHGLSSAIVMHADSRDPSCLNSRPPIDAVITSPPYPNEKDYTRTTRLESVILGFVSSKEELRAIKKGLVRSNTRGAYKDDRDDEWIGNFPEVASIAEQIEARRLEMNKNSGFERMYARVTKLYFGGMYRHFAELRSHLRPGARLAYVVGDQASYLRVMIRTGQILSRIAESLGYETESIDLFRTRAATATREQLREEVVVLRWKG